MSACRYAFIIFRQTDDYTHYAYGMRIHKLLILTGIDRVYLFILMNSYADAVRVGVAGATGYTGQELLRLLARIRGVRLAAAMGSPGRRAAARARR